MTKASFGQCVPLGWFLDAFGIFWSVSFGEQGCYGTTALDLKLLFHPIHLQMFALLLATIGLVSYQPPWSALCI